MIFFSFFFSCRLLTFGFEQIFLFVAFFSVSFLPAALIFAPIKTDLFNGFEFVSLRHQLVDPLSRNFPCQLVLMQCYSVKSSCNLCIVSVWGKTLVGASNAVKERGKKTSHQFFSNISKAFVYSLHLPTSCHHRHTFLFQFNSVRKNSDRYTKHELSLKVVISVNWKQKIVSVFCTLVAPQSLPKRNFGSWFNGG